MAFSFFTSSDDLVGLDERLTRLVFLVCDLDVVCISAVLLCKCSHVPHHEPETALGCQSAELTDVETAPEKVCSPIADKRLRCRSPEDSLHLIYEH